MQNIKVVVRAVTFTSSVLGNHLAAVFGEWRLQLLYIICGDIETKQFPGILLCLLNLRLNKSSKISKEWSLVGEELREDKQMLNCVLIWVYHFPFLMFYG